MFSIYSKIITLLQMANLGKLYTVKVRIDNAFYETILPEPMVEDIKSCGLQSYVVQHIKKTPAKYYIVGKYSTSVELIEVNECTFENTAIATADKGGHQDMDIEVCIFFINND